MNHEYLKRFVRRAVFKIVSQKKIQPFCPSPSNTWNTLLWIKGDKTSAHFLIQDTKLTYVCIKSRGKRFVSICCIYKSVRGRTVLSGGEILMAGEKYLHRWSWSGTPCEKCSALFLITMLFGISLQTCQRCCGQKERKNRYESKFYP